MILPAAAGVNSTAQCGAISALGCIGAAWYLSVVAVVVATSQLSVVLLFSSPVTDIRLRTFCLDSHFRSLYQLVTCASFFLLQKSLTLES